MKKIILFSFLVLCAGLQVNVYFASQQPSAPKGFFNKSLTEYMQGFREWFNTIYEKSPSARKVAVGGAVAATISGIHPITTVEHLWGVEMTYEGIKQTWQAILNGKISSSLAAGPLLVLGLGLSVMPTMNTLSAFDTSGNNISDKAQTAILALGLGVTGAGLISAVYHRVYAPIKTGEIPQTEVVIQTLKDTIRPMVEAVVNDDVAYPTRDLKINALLRRTDFLKGDDTDNIISDICNTLIKEISKKPINAQDKEINEEIDLIREVMVAEKITDSAEQIELLISLIKDLKPYARAVVSFLMRLRNQSAIDLSSQAQERDKREKLTPEQQSVIEKYAKERTEKYPASDK